jgi:pyruvate/2-oxoglutarate dehydrogenase complex dihydrolipoamide acyltransferase (E2) component
MDEQQPRQFVLRMPALELTGAICASIWHASKGNEVIEGDRLLEICAGEVIVDLPAPASGTLIRRLVQEDDPLEVGQELAIIECM